MEAAMGMAPESFCGIARPDATELIDVTEQITAEASIEATAGSMTRAQALRCPK